MVQYNERKGFTFFRSYFESAMKLPDKQRLAVYDAIVKYSFEGDAPALGAGYAIADAVFALIRPALDNSLKKSEAGAKGGRSRQGTNAGCSADKYDAGNKQNVSKMQADEKQAANVYDEHSVARGPAQADVGADKFKQQGFDEFWEAYPRKIGKGAAKKAWCRIKPTTELHKIILDAITQQTNSSQWQRDGGQYIPNPSTWLNQTRWEDEPQNYSSAGIGANKYFGGYKEREYTEEELERYVTSDFGGSEID